MVYLSFWKGFNVNYEIVWVLYRMEVRIKKDYITVVFSIQTEYFVKLALLGDKE